VSGYVCLLQWTASVINGAALHREWKYDRYDGMVARTWPRIGRYGQILQSQSHYNDDQMLGTDTTMSLLLLAEYKCVLLLLSSEVLATRFPSVCLSVYQMREL